jgi:hypothetical protein
LPSAQKNTLSCLNRFVWAELSYHISMHHSNTFFHARLIDPFIVAACMHSRIYTRNIIHDAQSAQSRKTLNRMVTQQSTSTTQQNWDTTTNKYGTYIEQNKEIKMRKHLIPFPNIKYHIVISRTYSVSIIKVASQTTITSIVFLFH